MLSASYRKELFAGLLAVAIVTAASAADAVPAEARPLQEVSKAKLIELRVLYLEDKRLPTLSAGRRAELFSKVEHLLRDWFGYRARLREVGTRNLADYFAARAVVFQEHPEIVGMQLDTDHESDLDRLRPVIQRALSAHSLLALADRLGTAKLASHEQVGAVTLDFFLKRLREIRSIPLAGGGTFADFQHPEWNSYMHWCALMHEMNEADIILTNSLCVGADMEMDLGVIERGGVTTGITNNNRHNSFQAATMVGMFPFLSDAPFWQRERGPIPEEDRLDVIATMMMHEFSHMLLRHAHPGDHPPHCVHSPAPRLRYYDWHLAIGRNGPCRLPHSKVSHY